MGTNNVKTNEGAREIASLYWFRANAHYEDAQKSESVTGERVRSYNLAGYNYKCAHDWFSAARGLTIGHGKSARYERQAADMKEKSELAYECSSTLSAIA